MIIQYRDEKYITIFLLFMFRRSVPKFIEIVKLNVVYGYFFIC